MPAEDETRPWAQQPIVGLNLGRLGVFLSTVLLLALLLGTELGRAASNLWGTWGSMLPATRASVFFAANDAAVV